MKKRNSVLLLSFVLFALLLGTVNASEGVNLALGKPVSYSTSVETFGWLAEFINDGIRDFDEADPLNAIRGWSSAIRFFDPLIARDNSTQWIKLDLEDEFTISRVDLYPRPDGANVGLYFPIDYVIQVSSEQSAWEQTDESDEGWTTVVTKTGVERPQDASPQSLTFDAINARYVRLKATNLQEGSDGYVIQIAEFEVYQ